MYLLPRNPYQIAGALYFRQIIELFTFDRSFWGKIFEYIGYSLIYLYKILQHYPSVCLCNRLRENHFEINMIQHRMVIILLKPFPVLDVDIQQNHIFEMCSTWFFDGICGSKKAENWISNRKGTPQDLQCEIQTIFDTPACDEEGKSECFIWTVKRRNTPTYFLQLKGAKHFKFFWPLT